MINRFFILCLAIFLAHYCSAQELKLPKRKINALGGKAFAESISDSTLTLQNREMEILNQIKSGNVPGFLRHLTEINFIKEINGQSYKIKLFVLPDYFAIGSNIDYFYIPMTPILAQKVAYLTQSVLPTRALVNEIYNKAEIKLRPQPILPTKAMITLPVFIAHNDSVQTQLKDYETAHLQSKLTAGNKKDVIISNKIYNENSERVVIYGWHKLDGKNIQPLYNKHTNTWADYSHGIRLIQNKIYINGKKEILTELLADPVQSLLFSDEGLIEKPYYPIPEKY